MNIFSIWGGDSPRNGDFPEDGDRQKKGDHQVIVTSRRLLIVPEVEMVIVL